LKAEITGTFQIRNFDLMVAVSLPLKKWRSHRFFTVVVSAFAVLVENLFLGIVLPLLPVYERQFGLDSFDVGGLVAAYAGVQILACPVASLAVDRFGARVSLFAGLASMAASTLLFAFADVFWLMVVARMLQGTCGAVTWTAALAMLPLALPPSEQGRATGMVTTIGGIGSVMGPSVGGALFAINDDRRTPFFFMLGVIALDLVMRMALVDTIRPELLAEAHAPKPKFMTSVRELLRDHGINLLMFSTLIGGLLLSSIMPIMPLLVKERFGYEPWQIGLVLSARSAAYLCGSILVGWLSDRFKIGRDLMSAGFIALPLLFVALAFAENIVLVVLVLAGIGFFLTCVTTTNMSEISLAVDRRHHHRVFAITGGMQNLFWSAGTLIGPLMSSGVMEATSSAVSLIVTAGTLLPLGLIFVFFNSHPHWRRKLFSVEKAAATDGEALLSPIGDVPSDMADADAGAVERDRFGNVIEHR
jgi:DHA1 family solute carrier family 18 vesicular amine transporter 1/2